MIFEDTIRDQVYSREHAGGMEWEPAGGQYSRVTLVI